MNFKKEYEKAFADISADDTFKKQLADELKKPSASRFSFKPYAGVLATAAALAVMVGAVHYTGVLPDDGASHDTQESVVVQKGLDVGEYTDMLTSPDSKADGENKEADDETYALFVSLLAGDELEALYCSEEQDFTEEDILDAQQVERVADKLAGAVSAVDGEKVNVKYYKAVLEDNRTILFEIWDEEYISIAGIENIYKMKD